MAKYQHLRGAIYNDEITDFLVGGYNNSKFI